MKRIISCLIILFITIFIIINCNENIPARNQIPVLKNKLLKLQTAVQARNRSAIDSLLSPKILSKNQNSDSLLNLVYQQNGTFPFKQFGGYEIVYTNDKARIDCFIMDTSGVKNRPITFYLINEHNMWLVTSFKISEVNTLTSP